MLLAGACQLPALYLGGEIVKPQGLVMPTGRAMGCAEQTEVVGGRPARVITSTLVTDHRAYGGHHRALFADHRRWRCARSGK